MAVTLRCGQVPTPVTAVLVCFPLTPEYKKTLYATPAAGSGAVRDCGMVLQLDVETTGGENGRRGGVTTRSRSY
jgi:hypothetical protein